ncbi:MAG: D-tyrosyl-tRNA(Tyr) deacylase [Undibacterium sp.]|nr:D-tyrosyl-tRNA(Tyr) deacylase [Opitutaceae bacterium]
MRAAIRRVASACAIIAGERVGTIEHGILVLLGIAPTGNAADARRLAEKTVALRIFPDDGKMNLSVRDATGGLLVVSQFRLFTTARKGLRPSFNAAAPPDLAIPLSEKFCELCAAALARPVATGRFGTDMKVSLVNDGPSSSSSTRTPANNLSRFPNSHPTDKR